MKFIHIADVHLGATPDINYPWGRMREKEIYETFKKVIFDCNNKEIDLLLIAGDLFHKQPLIRELKEVNYLFEQLKKTKVVIIAGNHDYLGARSNYNDFSWCSQVYMLNNEEPDSIYLEDINTEIYGFSYHTRDVLESRVDNIYPGVEERINILLTHGGDDRNQPLNRKTLLQAGFDYVALGHIHKAEWISERMAYSGSLEPLDKNEYGKHGYIEGEILKNVDERTSSEISEITTCFVPVAKREYIKVELDIKPDMTNGYIADELSRCIEEMGKENIYRIELSGKSDVDLKIDLELFQELGNVVEISDRTLPDYDFEQLKLQNHNNIIGLYIDHIQNITIEKEVQQKALYLGIEALLGIERA